MLTLTSHMTCLAPTDQTLRDSNTNMEHGGENYDTILILEITLQHLHTDYPAQRAQKTILENENEKT